MQLDVNLIAISCLSVVVLMLLVYIAWRFREERVIMFGLKVDDLLTRAKDAERLLQNVRRQKCWNCDSTDKDVSGNLFEDNALNITCKQCGTQTVWKRGKRWALETETKASSLNKLKSIVKAEKES